MDKTTRVAQCYILPFKLRLKHFYCGNIFQILTTCGSEGARCLAVRRYVTPASAYEIASVVSRVSLIPQKSQNVVLVKKQETLGCSHRRDRPLNAIRIEQ